MAFICYPGGQCLLAGVQSLQLQTLLFPAPGCRVPWRHGNQTQAGASSGSSHLPPCGCCWASQVCNPPDTGTAAAHLYGDHSCSSAFLSAPGAPMCIGAFCRMVLEVRRAAVFFTWRSPHTSLPLSFHRSSSSPPGTSLPSLMRMLPQEAIQACSGSRPFLWKYPEG